MARNAYDVLAERGFIQQVTDADAVRALFAGAPVSVYVGYDPTAASLHVGHLLTLMALMHLQRAGHRPVAVLGGGTALVGDPSGKTEMRQMLTQSRIEANVATVGEQIRRLLGGDAAELEVVNNGEWLCALRYIDFLRDVGRHFSVNRMLAAEAYRQRLERGLSFIEFNYQLLQAYDFLELHRRYGCSVQMGGDDQWGNILAGVDLVRRMDHAEVHGLTVPLLLTAAGEKMGKTASGAVWLDPERVAPYDYYQYWVNVHDADVARMLLYFTFLPTAEVAEVEQLQGAPLNAAKSVLAYEATAVVHGESAAMQAHEAAQGAFGRRALPRELLPSSQVPRQVQADTAHVPTTEISEHALADGMQLPDALAQSGLCASKKEARRKLAEGAVRLNGVKTDDSQRLLLREDFRDGELELRVGKKKVHKLRLLPVSNA